MSVPASTTIDELKHKIIQEMTPRIIPQSIQLVTYQNDIPYVVPPRVQLGQLSNQTLVFISLFFVPPGTFQHSIANHSKIIAIWIKPP